MEKRCQNDIMRIMATTTVRLPEPLKLEAETLADALGISLNALMAVALRDYIDRPVMPWSGLRSGPSAGSPLPQSPAPGAPAPVPKAPKALPVSPAQPMAFKPPKSRSDPCPCGARDRSTGHPVKFKHCHGRDSGSASGAGGSV